MKCDEVPAESLVRSLTVDGLPSNWTVVDAVLVVKCLSDEGEPLWATRWSTGLNQEELLGVLRVQQILFERELTQTYLHGDDDPE